MESAESTVEAESSGSTFLGRHQFLIYRLFSLAGLLPVGAYVVVHLLVNASVLAGPAMQTTDKSLPELRQEIRGAIARARLLVAQAEA